MPSAYSQRKRQTRLTFTPLSDFSPAKASAPEHIRDRAAAITIDGSPSAKRRRVYKDQLPTPEASSLLAQDNGSDVASTRPRRKPFLSTQETVKSGKKPRKGKKREHVDRESSESSSESDVLTKTTPKLVQRKSKTLTSDQEDDEESDVPVRSSQRRRPTVVEISDESESEPKGNIRDDDSVTVVSSDEEDDVPVTARGRGNIRITSKPHKNQDSEQDDLDEDLEFLGDADVDTPRARRHNNATPKKKTAKQKALEALRRRRTKQAGGNEASDYGESHESEEEQPVADASLFRADEYDDDFVDYENDDTLGAPVELPFEFSSFRTRKTKDLFKFVVEWMVQKKINPAFRMEDDVYRIAFDRTNDYVKGMGGSKFQSSAWTSEFLRALKGRPVLEENSISGMGMIEHCAACNRTGHPATFEVHFTGNTYDAESLEEHSDDEGDDDVPSPDTTYYVGRFCMQNARIAHSFQHWKFHLNEWVVDYLRNEGHLSASKIVERDRWNTKKRREYANSVVDHMEETGEIKTLYRDFKSEISQAQESTQGRYDMSSP